MCVKWPVIIWILFRNWDSVKKYLINIAQGYNTHMSNYVYTGENQLIHSNDRTNCVMSWYSTDTQIGFNDNRTLRSDYDSRYNDLEITYNLNSLGFRTPEFLSVAGQDKPWFLAMGCSYTFGVGLAQQHRWSDRLAKKLKRRHLNIGQPGAGLDQMMYNSLLWIKNLPLPEFVVIQHSEITRELSATHIKNNGYIDLHTWSPEGRNLRAESTQQFEAGGEIFQYFRAGMYTNIITHMWNSVGVPCFHWTHHGDGGNYCTQYHMPEFPDQMTELVGREPVFDLARDCAHDGVQVNEYCADYLALSIPPVLEQGKLNIPAPDEHKLYADLHANKREFESRVSDLAEEIRRRRDADPFIYK